MTDYSPPRAREGESAPTAVCSRWLGDSPCGAAATHHVIWDLEMRNGCLCPAHLAEARQRWCYAGLHPYTEACAASGRGAVWVEADDCCILPPAAQEPLQHWERLTR